MDKSSFFVAFVPFKVHLHLTVDRFLLCNCNINALDLKHESFTIIALSTRLKRAFMKALGVSFTEHRYHTAHTDIKSSFVKEVTSELIHFCIRNIILRFHNNNKKRTQDSLVPFDMCYRYNVRSGKGWVHVDVNISNGLVSYIFLCNSLLLSGFTKTHNSHCLDLGAKTRMINFICIIFIENFFHLIAKCERISPTVHTIGYVHGMLLLQTSCVLITISCPY